MFKVRCRTQIGAGLHFATDVSIALNYIKDLGSAGATSTLRSGQPDAGHGGRRRSRLGRGAGGVVDKRGL